MNEKFFTYRGNLTALAANGKSLAFVTQHPDNIATAVYRLDCETLDLTETPLPAGGRDLTGSGDDLWIAGTDGKVHTLTAKAKTVKTFKPDFDPAPAALAQLSEDRLAILAGPAVVIVKRNSGDILQSLELPESGTALAADPTGNWLAVGTQKGNILVFECEEKDQFQPSEAAKLHEGAVTALLFEPEELRFLSTGSDLKLLVTHARGKLEPEDRGRGGMHEDVVTSITHLPGDRFATGSRDGSCKNWTRGDRTRPSTQSDGLVAVVALAVVEVHSRPHLVAACHDNTLRFFLLDANGKFGQSTHKLNGAVAFAQNELDQTDTTRRDKALRQLADWNDGDSLALLAQRVVTEADADLRRLATKLIADSGHPHAVKHLEAGLTHPDEVVRLTSFEGLRAILGPREFQPLDLALKQKHENIAVAAVQALGSFAADDDRAHARLVGALDHQNREVSQAALLSLEEVHGSEPEGDLLGLASKQHEAVRTLALIRLFQRKFLDQQRVLSAIRRQLESNSAEVRQTALLVLILSRNALATPLRERDADLHRLLFELETFSLDPRQAEKKGTLPKLGKPKATPKLTADDLEPLLQATASRALDTCVTGTRYLALLGDGRALGLLLQLSREEDNAARVAVCRGLANLHDIRAEPRLQSLLFDSADEVRDAAFTAIAAIHDAEPLRAVAPGFAAAHGDVHRRALELLIRTIRKTPPKAAGEPGWDLLLAALNDPFEEVRGEVLKSILNLNIGGGQGATLRFLLKSAHVDIRREVLTESIAQAKQSWAWELLLELFDDPAATIRTEAFEFALKETKRRDLKPMAAGLKSKYPDVRQLAIHELLQQHKPAAQELIVTAVHDDDLKTRQAALDAIVSAGARDVVCQALDSQHIDIRLKAAKTLAKLGDPATFQPLVDLIRQEQPTENDPRYQVWAKIVAEALDGLSDLRDPRGIDVALPFLQSKQQELRKEAASAIAWSARTEHVAILREHLSHDDPAVRFMMVDGLAILGLPEALPFLKDPQYGEEKGDGSRFLGFAFLDGAGELELLQLLDVESHVFRRLVLTLVLARELRNHDGTPRRLLACLSSSQPRVRLVAAEGLRCFTTPTAFREFVVRQFNERDEGDPWQVSADLIEEFTQAIVFTEPWIRAHLICLLGNLGNEKSDAFELSWQRDQTRFADEVKRVAQVVKKNPTAKITATQADLDELAFGTYVGLVREQGSAHARGRQLSLGPQVIRVRETAVRKLLEMAQANNAFQLASIPVLMQSLSDPHREVRNAAFEALQTLQVDAVRLAAEAIETGFDDLGVAGLKLLTSSGTAAQGRKVLEEVMLTRTDELAVGAAELLRERGDPIRAAASAINAAYPRLRRLAVGWLAADYQEESAQKGLQSALKSRFNEVREAAAMELARKKDGTVFEALVEMLQQATDANLQSKLAAAIVELGDPRGPDALLDRLERDPTGTAREKELIQGAGQFRLPATADRLLKCLDKKEWRNIAYYAVRRLSGYDQSIEDPLDESPDRTWLEKQHPRHDDILARLVERLIEFGEEGFLQQTLPDLTWAQSNAVDPVLVTLTALPNDMLRNGAVTGYGWRLRKRNAAAEPLVKALEHKDPLTKFLAAEGLATAGKAEGISTLLAAIELMDDLDLRRRAVISLGKLADNRALDMLLRLAGEDEHALQEEAAEAIGHLGKSEKAEQIFKLLEQYLKRTDELAVRAVHGFRWFNSPTGWQLVRERAGAAGPRIQIEIVRVLGYNDDPATRELLLKAVANDPPFSNLWDAGVSFESARRLFGPDSLEPDYAALKSNSFFPDGQDRRAFERVADRGEPEKIFDVLVRANQDVRVKLVSVLLERPELPIAVAAQFLESPHAIQVSTAAHILGRADKVPAASGKSIEKVLPAWLEKLQDIRSRLEQYELEHDDDFLEACHSVELLLWTAGRLDVAQQTLLAEATGFRQDRAFLRIQRAAVLAMGEGKTLESSSSKASKETRDALAALVTDTDPIIRQRATQLIAATDKKQATSLADQLVSDRTSFLRLARTADVDTSKTVASSLSAVHYQGVVLPLAIDDGNEKQLAATATNAELPDSARYGAIEALGRIPTAKAEKQLATIGQTEAFSEELRKSAWRALRRLKRQRAAAK